MPQKRVEYITHGDDSKCMEIRKYIEDAGIVLDVRDLEKRPMEKHELAKMIGHLDFKHFLNTGSKSYSKIKPELSRDEILNLVATDNTLLKRPIIRNTRLMTIGCDKELVSEMLQILPDGTVAEPIANFNGNSYRSSGREGRDHRDSRGMSGGRSGGGRNRTAASAK